MKRLLPLALLSALLLSGCSTEESADNGGSLESMFDSNGSTTNENVDPAELPYAEGPSEIPSDLVPNE